MKRLVAVALCSALGCSSEGGDAASASAVATTAAPAPAPTPTPAATSAKPTASAPPKPLASNAIALTPLTLYLEPPEKVKMKARAFGGDVSLVDIDGSDVGLTIGQAHGEMAHIKEKRAKEAGFIRWVEESDTSAIAELEVDKVKEYYAFVLKPIGDLTYECGTLTMRHRSHKSEKAVRAALALCDSLRAK